MYKITTVGALLALSAFSTVSVGATLTVGPSLIDYDYLTITAAIAGSASGDEIVIQPGLYPENLVISGKDLILRNAGGGTVTVFGQGLNKCLVTSGASTDVEVFDIIFSNGSSASAGGGVSIEGSSRTNLTNCIIQNSTSPSGGGLYMSGGGTITNTIIRNNTSSGNGGGVYLAGTLTKSFIGCTIQDNTGIEGGGLAHVMAGDPADFVGCQFVDNIATNRGGAVAVLGTGSLGLMVVEECIFDSNHANAGGAVWVSDNDVFRALNSVFRENSAVSDGGVTRNEQSFEGTNCTFYNNTVENAAAADSFNSLRSDANTRLLNCIVVNASANSNDGPGNYTNTYTLLPEGPVGAADANGNFNANPMFVDPMGLDSDPSNDFKLMSNSPAIDAGNSRGNLGGTNGINVLDTMFDLLGNVRNLDDLNTPNTGVSTWELCIDLGAYEFQPVAGSTCTADLNNDGTLNFFDVSTFLSAFSAGCP